MGLYNWKRDYHDARDVYVQNHPAFTLVKTSHPTVDLRKICPPVFDQGTIGSCTGNAIVAAVEFLENKDHDFEKDNTLISLSRLFVYYNERSIENSVNQDAGAQISDGIASITNTGVCTEALWPYSTGKIFIKPADAAYADAATRKITASARVSRDNGMDDIKKVLSSGYPIVFGFSVFDEFQSEDVAATGVLHMPPHNATPIGGHAVLMVGYDDAKQRVIVRNSWGSAWGDNGYFYMPYAYITDRDLASDFWTVTK